MIGGRPADAAGRDWLWWVGVALCLLPLLPVRLAFAAEGSPASLESEFGFLEAEDVEKIPLGVVSRGPPIPAGLAPAVVDVITGDEIRASGARTLAELLSERVGFDVSIDQVVPRGLNTSPSAAGITLANHRTLLLIDGRPTNDLFFGEFLAGRELPLEHVARIEIIRGPGSALYGTNAMAGVINVVTKDYADEPGPGVIGEYGSFSTRRVDAFAGAGDPEVNGNFFFRYFGTGGANQIGRNDNQRELFGFGRSSLGPLTLESDALDFRQELPGLEGAPTPEDRVHRNRYSVAGKLDPPLGEDLKLTARVYANLYQTRLLVASGPSRTGLLAGAPIPDRTTYDERRLGEEIALTSRPFSWLAITLGGEARQEHGEVGPLRCVSSTAGDVEIDRLGCDVDQDVYALFLEDQVTLPFDLTLTAGFRYDSVSISGDRVNPRLHLIWKPGARTAVKLGYGEAFRAPSFFELRGAQQFGTDTFVLGNPNLDPEVVRTVEGEITHSFGRFLNTRVSSFFTRGNDMITQTASVDLIDLGICPPCGVQADSVLAGLCPIIGGLSPLPLTTKEYCFVNSSRVEVLGVESSAGGVLGDLPIPGEISYGVNYTFQTSKNRSDVVGEPDLPLTPRHKANLLFNYRPTPELSIFWHTHWVGRQFADAAERRSLSSYFNQNLNLKYRVSPELELGVGFYNLFGDDRNEALGVPREPRTILGSIAYRFASAPALPAAVGAGAEPPALGEARTSVERARAAGAEALDLTAYKESLAHLLIAEQLQAKGAGRDRVVAAAELSREAAMVAEASARELGGAPAAAAPTPPPPTPTPEPTRRPRRTPRAAAAATPAANASPRPATRVPTAEPDPARVLSTPAAPSAIVPTPTRPMPIVPTPIVPTPTRPLPVVPTPTRPAPQAESAHRILILQSDGGVPIYRDAAARLTSQLSGRVELRDLHGDREQAIEAVRESGADLVIAVGAVAATAAKQEISNRPVVFCAVLNPERYKLRAPNVAGVSFEVSAADQLARIHEALPTATRIGVIYDPEKTAGLVAAAEQAAGRLGLVIVKAAAGDPREVDPVFRSLKREIDVLWVIPDSTVVTRESFELLALHAAESRIPFVAFSESFARQGALLAFYPDAASVGEQCAALAVRVLAGEVPSAIGVQAPARTMVAVNRRIEDQLGITIGARLKPDVEIR